MGEWRENVKIWLRKRLKFKKYERRRRKDLRRRKVIRNNEINKDRRKRRGRDKVRRKEEKRWKDGGGGYRKKGYRRIYRMEGEGREEGWLDSKRIKDSKEEYERDNEGMSKMRRR